MTLSILFTIAAPQLDPRSPLLQAIRTMDEDGAALFGLPQQPPGADSFAKRLPALLERAALVRRRALPRVELAKLIARQARDRGAAMASVEAAERLADPEVVAVVTGQQVGLYGGPVLTLYKALGAISAARALTRGGAPAVPVFWQATFDHDLAEVAQIELATGRHDRDCLRLEGLRGGGPVGEVVLGAGIERVRREFSDRLRELADAGVSRRRLEQVGAVLARCYAAPSTFGEAFSRLMGGLLDDLGLVQLDPADPAFAGLKPARALVLRELSRDGFLGSPAEPGRSGSWSTRALALAAGELRRRGFEPVIPERLGGRLGVFFTDDDGRRLGLLPDEAGVRTRGRPDRMSWAEVRALASTSPGRFTPDALLRPLLQDLCLPTVAYIGGPSELQYQAQLGALYQELAIPRPWPLCRPSFTLIDAEDGQILGDPLPELLADADAPQRLVAAATPGPAQALLDGLTRLQDEEFAGFAALLGASGPAQRRGDDLCRAIEGLEGSARRLLGTDTRDTRDTEERRALGRPGRAEQATLVEPALARILGYLDQQRRIIQKCGGSSRCPSRRPLVQARRCLRWLRTQIVKRQRRRASRALTALSRVRPQGRPQERVISVAQVMAWLGPWAAHRLLPVAAPTSPHQLVMIPRNTDPADGIRTTAMGSMGATGVRGVAGSGPGSAGSSSSAVLGIGVVCLGGFGGSTKVAVELAAGLARQGHRIHLFHGAQPGALATWVPADVDITLHSLPLPSTPVSSTPEERSAASVSLRAVIESEKLDCLHVHYAADLLGCSLAAAQGRGVPVIATLHGTEVTRSGGVLASDLARCAEVTAVSTWLSEQARSRLGLRRAPVVISNTVDPEIFHPRADPALRARLIGDDEALLIHVSNLRPIKRPEDTIELLARVRAAGIRARLVVVGEGPAQELLRRRAADLGVQGSLSCIGSLAPDALAHHLSVADVALMPSASESFGLAALEAIACGTPVVGTRCGGLEEVIEALDAESLDLRSLLCEVGDVEAMAAAVTGLLARASASPGEHRALRRALVRAAPRVFPRSVQLAAYAALLGCAVAAGRHNDGVRVAG